jgi:galactarate dehydratase
MTDAIVSALKMRPEDNVSVVLAAGGLKAGTRLEDGTILGEDVPFGHKVAVADIPVDGEITRYGVTIGLAQQDLPQGSWVNEHRLRLPEAPALAELPPPAPGGEPLPPLEGYTFEGYRNADGSVGTRNVLAISTSVQCVAGVVDHVVSRIRSELLPRFPNVDGVVGLNHAYGCGVAINAPDAVIPIRTLKNLARNPNFGGEAMVIGLGCEKLRAEWLIPERDPAASMLYLQDPALTGFSQMVEAILAQAERHLERLNRRRRETCPASDLVVGVQCGGSDAFSGATANPVIGQAADLIVRAGGSIMFSEVTEVRDAVHLLSPRCADAEVSGALARQMAWYDAYLDRGGADRSANTTPGNKAGGLSGIVEKSLGSVAKSGTSPLADVIGPGERIRRKGLTFAATPAGDFVCGTLQLAAGMNLHIFSTGRGTPYNLPAAPTLKIATNAALAERWHDLMDLDAGRVVTEGVAIEQLGMELFELILDVASGRKRTAADRLGIANDLVLFNPAPVT